jgi:hypothetical protein
MWYQPLDGETAWTLGVARRVAADAVKRNQLHDNLLDWMNTSRDPFRGYF